jgi:hypothetical protein
MKKLLVVTAVLEEATGLALLMVPALVGNVLIGSPLDRMGISLARFAGIALIALGVACWPGTPRCGMLTYNALATVYFLYLAICGEWVGVLVWPVIVLHGVLTLLLCRAWSMASERKSS